MGKNTFYGIPKRTFHKPFWKSLSFVLWMRCKQMMCLVAKRREWLDMYVLSFFSLQVQRWQVTLVFGAVLEKNSWTCFFTQLILITTIPSSVQSCLTIFLLWPGTLYMNWQFTPDPQFEEVKQTIRSKTFGDFDYEPLLDSLEGNNGYGHGDYFLVGVDFPS